MQYYFLFQNMMGIKFVSFFFIDIKALLRPLFPSDMIKIKKKFKIELWETLIVLNNSI